MAQLFVQDESNLWLVFDLTDDVYRISLPTPEKGAGHEAARSIHQLRTPVIEPDRVERLSQAGALLLECRAAVNAPVSTNSTDALAASAGWAVLAGVETRLRINGGPIPVGIAALRHRDELCFEGGAPLYFSTERLVSVEAYRADDSPRCPRCTLPIELGDSCVCCPGCNVLHHQLSKRECWTYTPTCTLCDQSSDLAAGYRWSPEDL